MMIPLVGGGFMVVFYFLYLYYLLLFYIRVNIRLMVMMVVDYDDLMCVMVCNCKVLNLLS